MIRNWQRYSCLPIPLERMTRLTSRGISSRGGTIATRCLTGLQLIWQLFVGECCPELEVVEVITVLANGERLRLGDLEPGHKRLPRDARPARDVVRVNVGVQAAIARQAAAYSWTELIRHRTRIATLVSQLTEETPRRLSRNDNSHRRADWVSRLDKVDRLLADLPRPPATSELDIGRAAASWDSDRKEDDLTAALRHVASTLRLLVPKNQGDWYLRVHVVRRATPLEK